MVFGFAKRVDKWLMYLTGDERGSELKQTVKVEVLLSMEKEMEVEVGAEERREEGWKTTSLSIGFLYKLVGLHFPCEILSGQWKEHSRSTLAD